MVSGDYARGAGNVRTGAVEADGLVVGGSLGAEAGSEVLDGGC